MKKPILILVACFLAVAVIAFLAGCSSIQSGTITSKDHRGAFTTTSCTMVGKVLVCTPIFHPATWWFNIQGPDQNGETQTGYVYVDEPTWNAYEVGDYYQAAS